MTRSHDSGIQLNSTTTKAESLKINCFGPSDSSLVCTTPGRHLISHRAIKIGLKNRVKSDPVANALHTMGKRSDVINAYNCTKHESTGYSPYYLLCGHHPHLTVDFLFRLLTEGEANIAKGYAEKWAERMTEAYRIATVVPTVSNQVLKVNAIMTEETEV